MPLIITPRQLILRGQLYHQLGQLVSAGIGLVGALEMQVRKPPAPSYRQPLHQIVQQLRQGSTFSEALRAQGNWVPEFDIALFQAAEKSGRLDAVFRMLGNYYADRARMLRQMISDLMYPAFLLHFAAVLFPFIKFFSDGRLDIFLLKVAAILAPVYAVVGFLIHASQGSRGEKWRAFIERALRPVPVLGTARQYLALARLSAALEALLNAGVNIIEAWDMAGAACGSPALRDQIAAWRPQVVAGMTPAEAVGRATLFPEMFANLYRSGELSGQLDETLRRLYAYYEEEGTAKLRGFMQWVPRLIYLCVAALVGYKIIHFYLDYFNQVSQAGGF